MDLSDQALPAAIELRSYFVRHRNALLVRAEFSPLFTDHYLHLMQHNLTLPKEQDSLMKDALAALVLHLGSKPLGEGFAMTFHWDNPLLNLFVVGDNQRGAVAGRVFSDEAKKTGRNLLYVQTTRPSHPLQTSAVEIPDTDIFHALETYYLQSEQRPARFFSVEAEDIVFISAQPDCDEEWLQGLDVESVREIDQQEELSLLEIRSYSYDCGCTLENMHGVLNRLGNEAVEEVFQGDDSIKMQCPRCAAWFLVDRLGFDEFRSRLF